MFDVRIASVKGTYNVKIAFSHSLVVLFKNKHWELRQPSSHRTVSSQDNVCQSCGQYRFWEVEFPPLLQEILLGLALDDWFMALFYKMMVLSSVWLGISFSSLAPGCL